MKEHERPETVKDRNDYKKMYENLLEKHNAVLQENSEYAEQIVKLKKSVKFYKSEYTKLLGLLNPVVDYGMNNPDLGGDRAQA